MSFLKLLKEEKLRRRTEDASGPAQQSTATSTSSNTIENTIETVGDIPLTVSVQPIDYETFRLSDTYSDVFYKPNAIDSDAEERILRCIEISGAKNPNVWKQLRTRRLQCWGKVVPPTQDSTAGKVNNTADHAHESFPPWLSTLVNELLKASVFNESERPNHVLINEYQASEGIMHHTDGPVYLDKVAILSLCSPCVMTFRKRYDHREEGNSSADSSGHQSSNARDVFSVVLQPRSLLVFSKEVYSDYMHGIADSVPVQVVGADAPCLNKESAGVIDGQEVSRHAKLFSIQ
jgi:alkylated DNA repair protein alkB homolog 6